jgi:hypothetical protein
MIEIPIWLFVVVAVLALIGLGFLVVFGWELLSR